LAAWLPPVSDGHRTPRRQWSPSDYAIRNTIRSDDGINERTTVAANGRPAFRFNKLEQVNTRLDTLTLNFYNKHCNTVTAYTNCCHDENWIMFRNSELLTLEQREMQSCTPFVFLE